MLLNDSIVTIDERITALLQKKILTSVTTSTSGSLNTGLSTSTSTVLSAVVTSSSYPNGIYADVVIPSTSSYWLIIKAPDGTLIKNTVVTCYVYYTVI